MPKELKDFEQYHYKDSVIYRADCLEVMACMESKSVDLTVTSPPYNMRTRVRNGGYAERGKSEHFSKKYDNFSDSLSIQQYFDFHYVVIGELLRISKLLFVNIQIVTGSKEAWFRLMGEYAELIKDVIVWDKGEGQPAMHDSVINRSYELILLMDSEAKVGRAFSEVYFNRGEMPDVWRLGRGGNGNIEGHSALFPVELASKAINGWTDNNQTIFDPFMGSGTTGVAAKLLRRNFVGCEIDPTYFALAKRRIDSTEWGMFE